jgi:hypothetical protein
MIQTIKSNWTSVYPPYRWTYLFDKIPIPNWNYDEIAKSYLKLMLPITLLFFATGLFSSFDSAFYRAGVGFIGSSCLGVGLFAFILLKD